MNGFNKMYSPFLINILFWYSDIDVKQKHYNIKFNTLSCDYFLYNMNIQQS